MRNIGLLGGMSFESSAVYYRLLNEGVRARLGGLHSARLVMHSLDFDAVVQLQRSDRWDAAGGLLAEAARGVQAAGAECLLICSNTMHRVATEVQSAIGIPLLDIVTATADCLRERGLCRPLLLATRYTMEHGFYADKMRSCGIDVCTPREDERIEVHRIIFEELCAGRVDPDSRERLLAMVVEAQRQGADSVLLGCTELGLILDPAALPVPGFDSTVVHCEAALAFALAT